MRLRYLLVAASLLALSGWSLAQDCGNQRVGWNTPGFFRSATVAEVQTCLETGARVDARDNNGNTPLHWVVRAGSDLAIITVLLEAGARVSARDKQGDTPLHSAARSSSDPKIIEVLLEAGADVNVWNEDGTTPLHYAARYNDSPAIIWTLVEAGADVKAQDGEGTTPLHYAARYSANPAIIEALLGAGADAKAQDGEGAIPLLLAVQYNENLAIVQLLLESVRSVEASLLLLLAAASNPNPEIITLLLDAGADVNVRNEDGTTPLHYAAGLSDNPGAIIQILLDAGADGAARNLEGNTPWDYAKPRGATFKDKDVYWRLNEARFETAPTATVTVTYCERWNTSEFFGSATPVEVTTCLAAGGRCACSRREWLDPAAPCRLVQYQPRYHQIVDRGWCGGGRSKPFRFDPPALGSQKQQQSRHIGRPCSTPGQTRPLETERARSPGTTPRTDRCSRVQLPSGNCHIKVTDHPKSPTLHPCLIKPLRLPQPCRATRSSRGTVMATVESAASRLESMASLRCTATIRPISSCVT